MSKVRDSVRELIRRDQLREAIELIDGWIKNSVDDRFGEGFLAPLNRDIDLLLGEESRLARDVRRQTTSEDAQAVREARLREGALELADELERQIARGNLRLRPEGQNSVSVTAAPTDAGWRRDAQTNGQESAQSNDTATKRVPSQDSIGRPIVFISYAHADEPEKPAEGEVRWLSFVVGYLKAASKRGVLDIWTDTLMRGGDDWDPEIERKLRTCDIFVLLVSPHSMSSDYVVDREIAVIRQREASGEEVHFYPLLLTPTPKIALDEVGDKNLRPGYGRPLSSYPPNDRYQQMSMVADEIIAIAHENAERKAVDHPDTG